MMKRTLFLAALALTAFAVFAQEAPVTGTALLDKAFELQAQAQTAYEEGDYDSSVDLAAQAEEYFRKYREYRYSEAARADAVDAMTRAKARLAEAEAAGLDEKFPSLYGDAGTLLDLAQADYDSGDYVASTESAENAIAKLDLMETGLRAWEVVADARSEYDRAMAEGLRTTSPAIAERAGGALEAAEAALEVGAFDEAIIAAQKTRDELAQATEARRVADLLKEVERRIEWADANKATVRYPAEYASATAAYAEAEAAFAGVDLPLAESKAREALALLEAIREIQPLPKYYVVRLVPGNRDCLWNIAALPFVYNDPALWYKLYDANRTLLRDPANPDFILPGQRIVIPSASGEARSGVYDPSKEYEGYIK